ncbi:hypothetical protein ACOI22_03320 [Glaciecola sp. 2405UD65-10]|uniref:hypothetical protein n=1 Tax=Glaciecola sp. 2405UD65-10 TaxID=3397244 RepID=UPI003B5AFDB6
MGLFTKVFDFFVGWLTPDAPKQELSGAELTKAATDAYIHKIYGTVKKHTGTIIFKATNDADDDDIANDLLHIVIVWAEQVESIDAVYVDDIDVTSNSELFTADNGDKLLHVRNFPNGMDGYSDQYLTQAGWRTSDKCLGKACSYIRLEYAEGENKLRSEPAFTADITGTTSQNPLTHLKDFLQSNIYGKGESVSRLDLTAFNAAESTADTLVPIYEGATETRPLFTSNVAIDTGESVLDNVNALLKGFRGLMPIIDGKLTPIIEKDDPVVSVPILHDDIIEAGNLTSTSKNNRFNRVVVEYTDDEANSTKQEVIYPEKDSAIETAWLAADNGVVLEQSVSLDTCRNYYEAKAFAKAKAEVSRDLKTFTVILELWGIIYEVGDIVPVTYDDYGFIAKPFRVTSTKESNTEVELTLREHQPSIYDFNFSGDLPTYPATHHQVIKPQSPSNFTLNQYYNQLKQLEVQWSGTTTRYEIQLLNSIGVIIEHQVIARKFFELRNLSQGNYTFRARAVGVVLKSDYVDFQISVDQTINSFTWRAYADDINGNGASLTDSSKAFIGFAFNQLTETASLADLSKFVWISAGGSNGLSAYEIWLSEGNSGSISTFLDSLNGNDGIPGNAWIYATSTPSASTGRVNDFALVQGRYVYQKTDGSTWTYRYDLQGPNGADGTSALVGFSSVESNTLSWKIDSENVLVPANDTATIKVGFNRDGATVTQDFIRARVTRADTAIYVSASTPPLGGGMTLTVINNSTATPTAEIKYQDAVLIVYFFLLRDGQDGRPGTPGADGLNSNVVRDEVDSSTTSSSLEILSVNAPAGTFDVSFNVTGYAEASYTIGGPEPEQRDRSTRVKLELFRGNTQVGSDYFDPSNSTYELGNSFSFSAVFTNQPGGNEYSVKLTTETSGSVDNQRTYYDGYLQAEEV